MITNNLFLYLLNNLVHLIYNYIRSNNNWLLEYWMEYYFILVGSVMN
jgi:hypothetical protein